MDPATRRHRCAALAAALLAAGLTGPAPARAHGAAAAARLGADVQRALARAAVAPAVPVTGPRTLRLAVLPIELPGQAQPSPADLRDTIAGLNALYDGMGGGLHATAVIAPPYPAATIDGPTLGAAVAVAAARRLPLDGTVPVFVAAEPTGFGEEPASLGAPTLGALLRGRDVLLASAWAHQLGHALGLGDAVALTCPIAGIVAGCAETDGAAMADFFDLMGLANDRFSAFQLRVLGLQRQPDAAPGTSLAAIARPGTPGPQGLRIRTVTRDWFVESRSESHQWFFGTFAPFDVPEHWLPGAAIVSRVERRYLRNAAGAFPRPYRFLPAKGLFCTETLPAQIIAPCGPNQVLPPGNSLTVPGAFQLVVLPPAADGTARVRTTWTDATPPALQLLRGRIVKPWGGTAALALDLRSRTDGAGIAAVDVVTSAATIRIDADTLPALVRGTIGRVRLHVPAPRSGMARVALVDAAGHRSAVASVDVRRLITLRPVSATLTPAGSGDRLVPAMARVGAILLVRVATSPRMRGRRFSVALFDGPSSLGMRTASIDRRGHGVLPLRLPRGEIAVVVRVPIRRGRHVVRDEAAHAFYRVR